MFLQLYNDAESQNYIIINLPKLGCINDFMENYLEYLFPLENPDKGNKKK